MSIIEAGTLTDKLTIERRIGKPLLTLNEALRSGGEWKARRELKDWRKWAAEEADGWVLQWPVNVLVEQLRSGGTSDTCSPVVAYKGAVDGLVDAGVLPDDSPKYVHRVTFCPPQSVGWHGLRLTLTTITGGITK